MDQELTRAAAPRLKRKHPHAYLAVAFLCPALVLLAAYFAFGVYPFGGESVLVLDLNAQYVYFFGALRRVLYGDASLFYSFSRALGGEFLGIFAYYLASPLSLLVALFPADNILDALLVIFTLKCGLCSVTLAYYLEAHGIGTKPARIIFGALYALSGYGMIYQHNTMWIDCMMLLPLVALGIEKLISEKKYKLFTLSLGLAIFTNFYIGYMMCIFCFIYFFYAYFCIDKNPLGEKKHFLRALVRMGLFSAIAVGLAACIILPTYYSLGFGKTTFSDPTYSYKPRFDLLDLAAKLFLNSYDTVRPEGLPILYCGMLSLLFVPLFFIAKKVPLREKVGTGVLIGIFVFSFSIDAVDKFWHGMQAPNWRRRKPSARCAASRRRRSAVSAADCFYWRLPCRSSRSTTCTRAISTATCSVSGSLFCSSRSTPQWSPCSKAGVTATRHMRCSPSSSARSCCSPRSSRSAIWTTMWFAPPANPTSTTSTGTRTA